MSRVLPIAFMTLAGCKSPGLESVAPADDPASAEAPIPAYEPTVNPLEASAFDGEKLGGGGHSHHMHHGMNHGDKHGGKKEKASDSPHGKHGGETEKTGHEGHEGHGGAS